MTRTDAPPEDAPKSAPKNGAERAAKGLLAGWLTAKTTTWAARLTVWGMWLAALAAYGGYVWWRVRRTMRAEGGPSAPPTRPGGAPLA